MTLNLKYVVYESCQFDVLTIKKCEQNFFVKKLQVLADFLLRKIVIDIFLIAINQ